ITQGASGGLLTFTTDPSFPLELDSTANDFTGVLRVTKSDGVTLRNRGNLTLSALSDLDGEVHLTAGGVIDLTGANLAEGISSFFTEASKTTVPTDVTATGGDVRFVGRANLAAALTLHAGLMGSVTFSGGVTAGGDLTVQAGTTGSVAL